MNKFNDSQNKGSNYRAVSSNRVNKRASIVAIILFILIILGMFTFTALKKDEIQNNKIKEDQKQQIVENKYDSIVRVDAKHYFADGVHTLVGEIEMPTPCDLLEADSVVRESYPEQIEIIFSILNNSETCSQVITPQRFKVNASASSDATFSASLMGRPIELNLIPASEGELPEDFELFIKG